ncbi:VPLPA-CTERM-specific exosortase XrtD [Desulfovibrio sp. UCD-KL4C]|uniref:VPLPA-CTERM-specific exosortase XrtD n=1 Tax=Desulfovibrio sp. UCD-KL4C TaxID=2578120 RepID=UPI0025C49A64|nr:VPLPA-CTERM-specific exosortase XrtD [Desulfovibrio sp. UCD-KL4C]
MAAIFSFISVFAAWIVLYLNSFPSLLRRWNTDDYSYCWIVVPLALYIAWQRRDMLPKILTPSVKSGYVALLVVAVLFFIGKAGSVDALVFVSMWLSIVVIVLFVFGLKSMKAFFFPLAILAFFIPPPPFINRMLTFKLRLISSDLSVRIMQLIDIPVYREGNVIDLGMIKLHVVDACSGLRYVFPTILLGILIGYWFNKRPWQRFIIFVTTIPIAIITNALRIAIVGYIARNISVETAHNFFHEASGIIIYLLSISFLVLLSLILNLFGAKESIKRVESYSSLNRNNGSNSVVHVIVMAVFFAGMFMFNESLVSARVIPDRMSFNNFPLSIGSYAGERQYFDNKIIESLGADDYFTAVYRNKNSGRAILVLISYYNFQEPQRAAHNPISCLLGGDGWGLSSSKDLPADLKDGRAFRVRSLLLEKPGSRLLALYWFQQRGRIITNEYLNKVYLALDSIKKNRTDGALIRVELLLKDGETVQHGQQILNSFIGNFSIILNKYIPN